MPSWILTPLLLGAFFFFTARAIGERGERGPRGCLGAGLVVVGGLVFMTLYAGEIFAALAMIAVVGGLTVFGLHVGRQARQKRLERTRTPLRAAGAMPFGTAVYAGGVPHLTPQGVELYTDQRTLWLVPLHTVDDAHPISLREVVGVEVQDHLQVSSQLDVPASYAFGGAGYRVTSTRLGAVVITWRPRVLGGEAPSAVGHSHQVELGTVGIEGARQLHGVLVGLANAAQ